MSRKVQEQGHEVVTIEDEDDSDQYLETPVVSNETFGSIIHNNEVTLLVDGEETFRAQFFVRDAGDECKTLECAQLLR